MDILLWIGQILLAVMFGMGGFMKATKGKALMDDPKMGANMKWMEDFSETQVKTIGGLEAAAAVGLLLPWITQILPILTPLAGFGLVLTMGGAAYTHYRRGEMPAIGINVALMLVALFVALGRLY